VARQRGSERSAGLADVGDHRHLGVLDRKLDHGALLGLGQAHGFGGVHRQRQRVGAVALMEVDELAEQIEVDAALGRERHHGRVHQAEAKGGHGMS